MRRPEPALRTLWRRHETDDVKSEGNHVLGELATARRLVLTRVRVVLTARLGIMIRVICRQNWAFDQREVDL